VNFEWDPDKAVFADPLAVTYHDPDHSLSEERFITVGISRNGRVLIVAHSDRGENCQDYQRPQDDAARAKIL
jgi:hypothetical protein